MLQTEAKIFLSSQRGCTELEGFRRFSTFNFGAYFDENKQPFGALETLNEDTLGSGKSIGMRIKEDTDVIILPIVGGLQIKNSSGYEAFIGVGEVLLFSIQKGMSYEITNPYDNPQLLVYLQIGFKSKLPSVIYRNNKRLFDLDIKNQLLPITAINNPNSGYIGKYEGRKQDIYTLKKAGKGVFVFVIQGAFEVADRLLESRDGLALWNIETVEFEALSSDAILLLFDIENTIKQ